MKWAESYVGKKYGLWTVIGETDYRNYRPKALARCECGTERIVRLDGLVDGKSKSCGCLRNHGLVGKSGYNSFSSIKQRCFNPDNEDYAKWGGLGITACEGLLNARKFFSVLGERPSKDDSIDRIVNLGNYSCGDCSQCLSNGWPMNVRWASKKIQNRNRRDNRILEFQGKSQPLSAWCEELNLPYSRIKNRLLNLGWSVERALTQSKLWARG
jgi:hypothetical protein